MRIEVYSRHGDIRFVVHAESEVDRTVLTYVTSHEYMKDKKLTLGGSTHSCDVSATVAFNFGWVKCE